MVESVEKILSIPTTNPLPEERNRALIPPPSECPLSLFSSFFFSQSLTSVTSTRFSFNLSTPRSFSRECQLGHQLLLFHRRQIRYFTPSRHSRTFRSTRFSTDFCNVEDSRTIRVYRFVIDRDILSYLFGV